MKHQTTGELDDMKLIEGLTGEKNIYKRRAEEEPEVNEGSLVILESIYFACTLVFDVHR